MTTSPKPRLWNLAIGWFFLFILFLSFGFFLASCSGGPTSEISNPPGRTAGDQSRSSSRIFLVVFENTDYSMVIGNPDMPYMNGLADRFSLATNYFGNTHPSIGNYFMMTTGQIITNDSDFSGIVDDDNLVRQFNAAGKSWRVYAESLPNAGFLDDAEPYAKRHNPFAYFRDVVDHPDQAQKLVPLTELAPDLAANRLPEFVYILPNDLNNMHDCPAGGSNCTTREKLIHGDRWLRDTIDPILNSAAMQNSLMIVTFDEAVSSDTAHGGGHIVTILAGPRAKQAFRTSTLFQHQDLLKTVCNQMQLRACPGAGATAIGLGEMVR